MSLPDPRRYGTSAPASDLLGLVSQDEATLTSALRARAAAGADSEIQAALAAAPTRYVYARLWRALSAAVEKPATDEVAPRVFAIPWVIVCAGSVPGSVSCVLPDVSELARVLETSGVFGPSRNLGLSNVLCSIEALEALSPGTVLRWSQNPETHDISPAPIPVLRGIEEVHVRFLLGAAIAPAHAPDIVTTGANIGTWGTPALSAMAAQLATPGVQILPMARPPAGLYSAAYVGRRAGIEAALALFMSNALRRFRMKVGDPAVRLSSHASRMSDTSDTRDMSHTAHSSPAGGELRVTLTSPFDDSLVEGFRWPLHPADDLTEITQAVTGLILECRLPEPELSPEVLPDLTVTGAVYFPTP
jgi:hypothetical protein